MRSEDDIVGKIDRTACDCTSYVWIINNFCVCCEIDILRSPEFTTGFNNEHVWFLELYNDGNWNAIDLTLEDTTENTEVSVKCELSILNTKNQKTFVNTITNSFKKDDCNSTKKFFKRKDVRKSLCQLVPNKELTILCEIRSINVRKVNKFEHEKLLDVLQNLFEDPKHTDAQIVVGEKTFHVHKAILVSRSSWFKAAFEGGMQEQQENKVTVLNYDYKVVQEMLRFIYTGKVKGVKNFVDRLLDAAVFYHLDELKTICSDMLSDNLTVKNVLKTLELADTHRIIDLKKNVLNFMSLHADDLVDVQIISSNECKNCVVDK